jgi:hypothetical protein
VIGVSGLRDDDDVISPLAESVQLMDPNEGGPKSNRVLIKFFLFFLLLFEKQIWLMTIADCPILGQSAGRLKAFIQ